MLRFMLSCWVLLGTMLFAGGDISPYSTYTQTSSCREVVVLYTADREPDKVVNLRFEPESYGRGEVASAVNFGARATVLESFGDEYRIMSRVDGSSGWIKKWQTLCLYPQSKYSNCPDAVDANHNAIRKMDYFMDMHRDSYSLYREAVKAKESALGVIRYCDFSADLIDDYIYALVYYNKIIYETSY